MRGRRLLPPPLPASIWGLARAIELAFPGRPIPREWQPLVDALFERYRVPTPRAYPAVMGRLWWARERMLGTAEPL
jgi:hypothetical protein